MVYWKCPGLCTFSSKLAHGTYCLCCITQLFRLLGIVLIFPMLMPKPCSGGFNFAICMKTNCLCKMYLLCHELPPPQFVRWSLKRRCTNLSLFRYVLCRFLKWFYYYCSFNMKNNLNNKTWSLSLSLGLNSRSRSNKSFGVKQSEMCRKICCICQRVYF